MGDAACFIGRGMDVVSYAFFSVRHLFNSENDYGQYVSVSAIFLGACHALFVFLLVKSKRMDSTGGVI